MLVEAFMLDSSHNQPRSRNGSSWFACVCHVVGLICSVESFLGTESRVSVHSESAVFLRSALLGLLLP